jgi:hypothetical protein
MRRENIRQTSTSLGKLGSDISTVNMHKITRKMDVKYKGNIRNGLLPGET